jgi:hypothetical protein
MSFGKLWARQLEENIRNTSILEMEETVRGRVAIRGTCFRDLRIASTMHRTGSLTELYNYLLTIDLEDICDKPIRIQSYCAVARLHGV